jgi:hypothetical protein
VSKSRSEGRRLWPPRKQTWAMRQSIEDFKPSQLAQHSGLVLQPETSAAFGSVVGYTPCSTCCEVTFALHVSSKEL